MKTYTKHNIYKITIDRQGNFVINKKLRNALGIKLHEAAQIKVVNIKSGYGVKKSDSGLPIKWFKNSTRCRFSCRPLISVLVKKYKIREVFCSYRVIFKNQPIETTNERIFIIQSINPFFRQQIHSKTCKIN